MYFKLIMITLWTVSNCVNDSIRLINGTSSNNGVVEICLDGVWGSIISYSWNNIDASVVCRELGQPWESK